MSTRIEEVRSVLGNNASSKDAWAYYKQRHATTLTYPQFEEEWNKGGGLAPLDVPEVTLRGQPGIPSGPTTGAVTALTNSNQYPNTAPGPQASGLPTSYSTERSQGQAPAGQVYPTVPPQAQAGLNLGQLAQPLTPSSPALEALTQQAIQGVSAPRAGVSLTDAAAAEALKYLQAPTGWTEEEQRAMYSRAEEPLLESYNRELKRLQQQANVRGQYFGGDLVTAEGTTLTDLTKALGGISTDIQIRNALEREQQRTARLQQSLDVAAQQYGFGSDQYKDLLSLMANQQTYQMGLEQQAMERAKGLGALKLSEMELLGVGGTPGTLGQSERMQAAQLEFDQWKQGRVEELTREGWTQDAAEAEANRQWQSGEAQAGREQEQWIQGRVEELTREGWTQDAAEAEAQREWQSKEAEKGREQEQWIQGRVEELTREGWTQDAAQAEANRQWQSKEAALTREQEQWIQGRVEELTREGWTQDAAQAEANRQWQSGEAASQRIHEAFLQSQTLELTRQGWTVQEAAAEAERNWQTGEAQRVRDHQDFLTTSAAELMREGWTHDEAMAQAQREWQGQQNDLARNLEWGNLTLQEKRLDLDDRIATGELTISQFIADTQRKQVEGTLSQAEAELCHRIAVDNWAQMNEAERIQIQKDVLMDSTRRWQAELQAGTDEATAQRFFDERMFDKQAAQERLGWQFTADQDLAMRNWQSNEAEAQRAWEEVRQAREDAMVMAGWDREDARQKTLQEWQSGERLGTQEFETWKVEKVAELERAGWDHEAAQAEAQRLHDVSMLGKQQAFVRMERLGTQNYQRIMAELEQKWAKAGYDREDARALAEREFVKDMADEDRAERRYEFDVTSQFTELQWNQQFAFTKEQFTEANRQFWEEFRLDEEQFEATYGLQLKQYEMADAQFKATMTQRESEFARNYSLDERQFVEATAQFNRQMTLQETSVAQDYNLDEMAFHETNRQWQLAFDEQVAQAAKASGLDQEKLTEAVRQFDENMRMSKEQFGAQFGLDQEQVHNAWTLANRELDQQGAQFAAEHGLDVQQYREAHLQYMLNYGLTQKQIAQDYGMELAKFGAANTQWQQAYNLEATNATRQYNLAEGQFEYAKAAEDRRYQMALSDQAHAQNMDETQYARAMFESDRAYEETKRQFDAGLQKGMDQTKLMAGLEFMTSDMFAATFGTADMPENWARMSRDEQQAWLDTHPNVVAGAQFMKQWFTNNGFDVDSPYFNQLLHDGGANLSESWNGQPVNAIEAAGGGGISGAPRAGVPTTEGGQQAPGAAAAFQGVWNPALLALMSPTERKALPAGTTTTTGTTTPAEEGERRRSGMYE